MYILTKRKEDKTERIETMIMRGKEGGKRKEREGKKGRRKAGRKEGKKEKKEGRKS